MQPDERIQIKDLGFLEFNGERYVTHDARGCPRNACIETFDGYLRCWACHKALTPEASDHVLINFRVTKKETFTG